MLAGRSQIVFFGEPLGLVLGPAGARLDTSPSATISVAGSELNTAIALARLGFRCRFHSAVGPDPFGERILRVMRAEGIGVSNIVVSDDVPTGLIIRNGFSWREPDVFYHRSASAFRSLCGAVAEGVTLGNQDVFFTSGITLALGDDSKRAVIQLIDKAWKSDVPVCFDVNFRRKLWSEQAFRKNIHPVLPRIHTLFLGVEEGKVLTGFSRPAAIAKACLKEGVREVVIKDGAQGAWHFQKGQPALHDEAFALSQIVDPIGAGDAFDAGFLSGRLEGMPRLDSLRRGNALGAMACLAQGDWESLPSEEHLLQFIKGTLTASR